MIQYSGLAGALRAASRAIWRRLPRGHRQALFAAVTEFGVPRASIDDAVVLDAPVIVVGPLAAPTGIGQAARLALHALHAAQVPYGAIDVTRRLSQPATEDFPTGTVDRGPGTLLVYVTPPNCANALRAIPADIRRGKTLVAGWVCETRDLPRMWRRQAALFNVISAPSCFAAEAIAAAVERPVRVFGHPVDAEPWPPAAVREPRTHFTIGAILDVGSSSDRKNVEALIACIEIILGAADDIDFHLKVRDLGSDVAATRSFQRLLDQAPDRVFLIRTDDRREDTVRFLDRLDLLLSLSRAEGFALPYAEAIRRGVRVAAPRWGGPAEYLNDENSVALPFRLVPIRDQSGLYGSVMGEWAEIDPVAAARIVLAARLGAIPCGLDLPEVCNTKFFVRSLAIRNSSTGNAVPADPRREH